MEVVIGRESAMEMARVSRVAVASAMEWLVLPLIARTEPFFGMHLRNYVAEG
jgi:hypothetical protein